MAKICDIEYAPVVLFTYKRVTQTEVLLEYLAKCDLASETELFIYSDNAKKEQDRDLVNRVREIINDNKWKESFKSVNVILSDRNKGLANSVISGVTEIINKYGKVIVIEDDNIVSKDFITFMNSALNYYQDSSYVGAIAGYTLPIKFPKNFNDDIFLMGRGSSYAWATWSRFWNLIDWNVSDFQMFVNNRTKRKEFNKYGNYRTKMLISQMKGDIDSWAIRFSYAMYKNNKYFVVPRLTKVTNVGFDSFATHNTGSCDKYYNKIIETSENVRFKELELNKKLVKQYKKFSDTPPIYMRALKKITTKLREIGDKRNGKIR